MCKILFDRKEYRVNNEISKYSIFDCKGFCSFEEVIIRKFLYGVNVELAKISGRNFDFNTEFKKLVSCVRKLENDNSIYIINIE